MTYKLSEEILKLSVSKFWDSAKFEWKFENAYESEDQQTCLCGHFPIINVCVIKNTKNGNCTEVGNCCVNKFLNIDEGNKIFISIKRIKNDLTKSMSVDVVEYLKNKNIIDDFEFNFYINILRKRKLSDKQLEIKKKINKKLLDFTSSESNSQLLRINLVLDWARDNNEFDKTFINSIKRSCERTGKLTVKQKIALDNIICKWKIEK